MWLSSSSVGRKFIMAVTGAVLVLFVTFHCLMNAIAIAWPVAYNSICMFLGANWYALIASAGLAAFIIVHIIYAVMLTVQNRRARGHERYAISKRPAGVEWSSQNMLVLGIVILAFLAVHMIQFWAKMQLMEVLGKETVIPATAGTLFIQEAFQLVWTPIVYIIGFIALWFHMNHGMWSMFQSVGWDSTIWIPRLKKIACCWTTVVIALFIAEAIVFTVQANKQHYLKDEALRNQYKTMVVPMLEKDFGPAAVQQLSSMPFEQYEQAIRGQYRSMQDPQAAAYYSAQDPEAYNGMIEALEQQIEFLDFIAPEEIPATANPANN
ncbi:MAG: succinate dehydrogenase cytochrome b subunit [Bacteroides sp.]|nr:succinate dehydrogenase cytochrome b subunit [Bacteroides sp.]MBD5370492.1 succinate dehydrogenase cytochrome b subunit [Bacteroides sp.]